MMLKVIDARDSIESIETKIKAIALKTIEECQGSDFKTL